MKFLFSIYILLSSAFDLTSQQIILDESFDDWESQAYSYFDKDGDGNSKGIDITNVGISNDENYLFIYFDLNTEINIQQNNNLTIFIDTDNNVSTGISRYGIGADLEYYLGSRNGRYYKGSSVFQVFHNQLGLVTSPTVTGSKFEICLLRKFNYSSNQANMSDIIKVVISDEEVAGDRAPDNNGGYSFEFDKSKKFIPKGFTIKKERADYLRVMSYNVLRDNLFESGLQQNYRRIFKALIPDIIGFCEIYDNSSDQTAALIESYLPSSGNHKWYHAGVSPDIRVVSRYPIINSRSIDGNGAFLIDLGKSKLVFIVAHLPCCENENQRQHEVDNIMSFVRGIKFGISSFQVPQNTPVIIVGDMNLVGYRQQQQTFLTGNIVNNNTFGPDFDPDWDDSVLEDATPHTTNMPVTFTWNSDFGSYSAGRLDYVIYSGSVAESKNSFALWPLTLTNEQLSASGLQRDDVHIASDHLPVICDFFIPGFSTSTSENSGHFPFEYSIVNHHLFFQSALSGNIIISDLSGRIIQKFQKSAQNEKIIIDLNEGLSSGIYILHFQTENGGYSVKIFR